MFKKMSAWFWNWFCDMVSFNPTGFLMLLLAVALAVIGSIQLGMYWLGQVSPLLHDVIGQVAFAFVMLYMLSEALKNDNKRLNTKTEHLLDKVETLQDDINKLRLQVSLLVDTNLKLGAETSRGMTNVEAIARAITKAANDKQSQTPTPAPINQPVGSGA